MGAGARVRGRFGRRPTFSLTRPCKSSGSARTVASSSSPSTSRYAATACAVCPCVSSRTAASARTTADASAVHSRSAIARELDDALPRAVLRRLRRGGEQDVEAEGTLG